MTGVCYGCTDRQVGCHSKCEKYIKAKAEHDAQKQLLFKQRERDNNYYGFKQDVIIKTKRK